MSYKMLKLISGEIVLGEDKTMDESANEYVLSGVLQMAIQMAPNHQMALSMIPFNPFTQTFNESVSIKKSHVLAQFDPPQDIINRYVQLTSNIVVPETAEKGNIIV